MSGPLPPTQRENTPSGWLPALPRRGSAHHKYDFGQAMVMVGQAVGAAQLASVAAQRAGAGLVGLVCRTDQWAGLAPTIGSRLLWTADDDQQLVGRLLDQRIKAVLLGAGWLITGDGACERQRLAHCLAQTASDRCWVIDGGALSAFAGRLHEFQQLVSPLAGRVVLTPHEGEFRKLFGEDVADVSDRVQATRRAAELAQAVVMRKGAETLIASPRGEVWRHDASDTTWLATAGTGDVLAGLVVGFLAQGLSALEASGAACWLQRQAARLAMADGGGMGLVAEDVVDQLRAAWQVLFKSSQGCGA
jgi:hydroxyethylthiazole kinase-like uncharacterized protein yjeF